MKILKLSNNKYFLIIITLLIGLSVQAEDTPVDIWNIDKEKSETSLGKNSSTLSIDSELESESETGVYEMQSQKQSNIIKLDQDIGSQ